MYGEIDPFDRRLLRVGDGNELYWEACGNPAGKPALVLHGGPGSGCAPWHRRLFDPRAYRIVLFDQRGCGRSTPSAGQPETDLTSNTTWNLIRDIERLRRHLDVPEWLLLAGSWGSTLALAYAEEHPERVSEMVLFGVTTGRRAEFDWWFRGGAAVLFPQEWERLRSAFGDASLRGDAVEAYHRLLNDPNDALRNAAALAWCTWESATLDAATPALSPRFANPMYRMTFARLVTHYVRHDAFLEDDELIRRARVLENIPGTIVHGRLDVQAPLANAWALARAWPSADLVVVPTGHEPAARLIAELVRATDGYAASR